MRTIGHETYSETENHFWANDPISDDYKYLEDVKKDSSKIYKRSSFTDQIFGNTYIASRMRIEDAYPIEETPVKIEERNGVAIDRVFCSAVRGALFNYQVCTQGEFKTKIHLKNFTLPQLGLIGLVLRDLNEGWFSLGFGKSRGLGEVSVQLNQATVNYPSCVIKDNKIHFFGNNRSWSINKLLGISSFLTPEEIREYGFPDVTTEQADTPIRGEEMDFNFGVKLIFSGEEAVKTLFIRSMPAWKQMIKFAV